MKETQQERLMFFFEGCRKIYLANLPSAFPARCIEAFRMDIGKRYAKVVRGGSVHVFVDLTTGDVLKAASFKTPAKGARGNIHNPDYGLSRMTQYGAEYNR